MHVCVIQWHENETRDCSSTHMCISFFTPFDPNRTAEQEHSCRFQRFENNASTQTFQHVVFCLYYPKFKLSPKRHEQKRTLKERVCFMYMLYPHPSSGSPKSLSQALEASGTFGTRVKFKDRASMWLRTSTSRALNRNACMACI